MLVTKLIGCWVCFDAVCLGCCWFNYLRVLLYDFVVCFLGLLVYCVF